MEKIDYLKKHIALDKYTTIKVGGVSDYFSEPTNVTEFINVIKWAKSNKYSCLILGAGSNTLIKNISLKRLTVCTKKMRRIDIDADTGIVNAESGALLPQLSTSLAKNGIKGGEWIIGIPGTIGGAIYMNAGVKTFAISNNLISVKVIDPITLNIFELRKNQIEFDYRFSSFQSNNLIIIDAKFSFQQKDNSKDILNRTKKILTNRQKIQPYHLPSFGSVFKNPHNHFAGKLIEEAGLKGTSIGGAEVSTMHANFIINRSSATSDQIFDLIILIQKKVLQKKRNIASS